MQETILSRLEASRKELLDLGLRNPLLNYKVPKSRGLQIVREKSAAVYDMLVRQNKSMTFAGKPGKPGKATNGMPAELPPVLLPEPEVSYTDTKLQTNEPEPLLQSRILNTWYFARTSIEEQGINILYVAAGMLRWYEEGNPGKEARLAPLILIPVMLERSSARERFRLRYTGSEIGANLSLQAKMQAEFNMAIPGLPEAEDVQVEQYFSDVEKQIQHLPGWSVERNAIELGFFSFGKFQIYHDLDSEKWPDENKPGEHPLMQALFGGGFTEPQPSVTEHHHLDTETDAHELFQVVDADSSQLQAMLAVREGRNLVIQGPPGTGKSQTITNIIANAIGEGKKVLFVAEKMAALDVVKRRMDAVCLGEACLELHSHKANKKELLEELRHTLQLGKPSLNGLSQEIVLLEAYKQELNNYCMAVNAPVAESRLSPQQLIGLLLQIESETPGVKLQEVPIDNIEQVDAEQMHRAEAMAARIQARLQHTGMPSASLFWGSRLTVLLPHEQEALLDGLKAAREAIQSVQLEAGSVATFMGFTVPQNTVETTQLAKAAQLAAESPGLQDLNVHDEAWLLNQQDVQDILDTGLQIAGLYSRYKDILIPEAWSHEVMEIRQNLMAYGDKWYRFIKGDYNKSVKQLAGLCKVMLPKDPAERLQYVDDILEARRLETALEAFEPLALQLFGKRWQKQHTDWAALSRAALYLAAVHQQVKEGAYPPALLEFLGRNESPELSGKHVALLVEKSGRQQSALTHVMTALVLDEQLRWGGLALHAQPYVQQLALVTSWIERFPEIHQAIAWNNLAVTAGEQQFSYLITASTHWEPAREMLTKALQKTWYTYLIRVAVTTRPALQRFERASHEEVLEKFRKLDLLNLQYNRTRVALKHWENVPRYDAGGQVSVLRNEFNRKARHMPIRRLMQEAGLAIQAIKPVWMMSPMSIASFLAPGSIAFDLVIFDEASQVRPVEALGALLRSRQVVVVGDHRQLPPTSFFDKLNTDTEDEENVTADMQSILGMCNSQGIPETMLRWHYRSRHESLISLSNQEFYENRLVIFPSPGSRRRLGLAFHHLADAVYDRGKTRTNPREAATVADAVIEHALRCPEQTLGVVAFSSAQMQAIQFALETRRRQYPEAESFFKMHAHEPFFVKNLENVQGDERDVILISIGYGRTQDGKVPLSFGPLNNEGGERRLNVLITRAKQRCEVFSNITSEDISAGTGASAGIRALQRFLYYARHGRFDRQEALSVAAKRPFEDLVHARLENSGYTTRERVGSEGFYLDMAVTDQDHPGRFVLGIETDGSSYAAARSARDRDRLRGQVLENMGWKMHTVWSTDWLRDPDKEFRRLVQAIEKAKAEVDVDDTAAGYVQENVLVREDPVELPDLLPVYSHAVLPAEVAAKELHLQPIGKLLGWIEEIVKVEGPIHFDEAARRMVEAAGGAKIGSRIKHVLWQATRFAEQSKRIQIRGEFLWNPQMQAPVVRERSNLPASSRRLQYIAPEEISMAVQRVVENAIAVQPEAVVPLVARLFGIARVTEDVRKDILDAVALSISKGLVTRDGEVLKLAGAGG